MPPWPPWGLEKIDIPQAGEILDIGCGGGANIARLLARSKAAKVTGVDYSPVSVAKTTKVNADAIAKGRCEVREANVAALSPPSDPAWPGRKAVEKHCYFTVKFEKSYASLSLERN